MRECTASGLLSVSSRRSVDLDADVGTKVLSEQKLKSLLPRLNLVDL